MGNASAMSAVVMRTGLTKTAAAPWIWIPVQPGTSRSVMAEGYANVEDVYVLRRLWAPPVRMTPSILMLVCGIRSVWSVGHSRLEQRNNCEKCLFYARIKYFLLSYCYYYY